MSASTPYLPASRVAALVTIVTVATLSGCATSTSLPPRPAAPGSGDPVVPGQPAADAAGSGGPSATTPGASGAIRGGGYYLDDGPGHQAMPAIETLVDAVPRAEPLHRWANRPYQVFGRDYVPLTDRSAYREQGVASWYGRRFHGRLTSTGEPYDMYAMSAAHPTLPLPSYARVTNLENGRSVVVRVNDRGPFLRGRVIDMSAAAAYRLGYMDAGSARVEVELIGTAATAEGQLARELPGPDTVAATPPPAPAGTGSPAPAVPVPSAAAAEPAVTAHYVPHYVQLGAFQSRAAAADARQRFEAELDGLDARLRIVESGAGYRVQVGPYGDRREASEVVRKIRVATGLKPWIVAQP